jgi:eukaryotic-like serine/threonine-protein kinase
LTALSIPPVAETDPSRYELLHALGQGGTGAVFLAVDRETGEEVALKKLFNLDQRSVQRFKREFRALADLHHPNVVKLYDLQRAADAWFLTMEFIDGSDLQRELIPTDSHATYDDLHVTPKDAPDPARMQRIAGVFHQLALGIHAMHEAGMLHRDLKPSNVVVAKSGRVVLVDFGLVRELSDPLKLVTLDGAPAGTPAYMPPEQALGLQLTPASDWYAFGVMLYEVLTGVLPIDARNPIQLIQRKLSRDPAPLPRGAAPKALGDLCMRLLSREAANRPKVDEILRVLTTLDRETLLPDRGLENSFTFRTDQREAPALAMLIGRETELVRLHDALDCARKHQGVVMHVRGPSGAGKSMLIESFFDQLQVIPRPEQLAPVLLRSRCYEREAIPFKALDGIVDALVAHLAQLDDFTLAHVLPHDIHALTQLFPVFERLSGVQRLLATDHKPTGSAAQTRRSAERALRELFTRVAQKRTLVVWIDDLQWGDLDSASLIRDWLQRPADAPLLLILSYRSEERETSACLRTVMDSPVSEPTAASFELDLTPMRDTDVEALCNRRLGSSLTPPPALVSRIVSESRGNAFLASHLAALAYAKLQRGEMDLEDVTVEELVLRTSELLPEPARELLSVLAIAGRPVVPQIALAAAEVERDGRSHIHALQGLRLVRMRDVDNVRLLEVYHDRVREAVHSSATEAQRKHVHERLLRVLEASGQSDPAWLHELACGAGQGVLALRYGILAAEIASSSLAFERAAELYAKCLALTDARDQLASLWFKLGLALARCRRGAQAAEAYLKASEYAPESRRISLLQHAASHLLRSGRYDEGEALVQGALRALNVELPRTRAGYYAAIAWEYTRVSLLSRTVKPRPPNAMPPEEALRSEYYAMLAIETQAYAPLRAALFQMRALRLAYQCGEPMTVARALCMSATIACLSGTKAAARRAREQLELAERFVEADDTPDVRVELLSARAVCAMLAGRTTDVLAPAYAADEIYETRSAGGEEGDYYYMFAVHTVRIAALQHLGKHSEASAELRSLLSHAIATDNRTALLQASFCTSIMEQVTERCAGTRARLERERTELPRGEVGILHVLHMAAAMRAAMMTGEFDWAFGIVEMFWSGYLDSTISHSAQLAYVLRSNRACLQLNQFVASGRQGDPDRLIAEDLRWLSKKAPEPYRAPSSARLRARLAYLRNDPRAAAQLFRESMEQQTELGAADEAARERYALGCVLGGDEGVRLKAEALTALRALGVVDPEADMCGYYPELANAVSGA